jgi:hypothetical protein
MHNWMHGLIPSHLGWYLAGLANALLLNHLRPRHQ